MYNFYLDDVRGLPFGFHVQAYNFTECIDLLQMFSGKINTLSLDHDLGDYEPEFHSGDLPKHREKTGYDVMCWIEESVSASEFILPNRILVHSSNPAGRKRMQQVIDKLYR